MYILKGIYFCFCCRRSCYLYILQVVWVYSGKKKFCCCYLYNYVKILESPEISLKVLEKSRNLNQFFGGNHVLSVDELFAKASQRFATCLLDNINLCGKLIESSELPIIFDDNLKTTSVLFFIADFNLLSSQFDSFTFKLLYSIILYQ